MAAPSGAQFEIRWRDHRCRRGRGRWRLAKAYSVGDREVFDGYDVTAACDGARGQTLVPWPNRVQDGTWSWRGTAQQAWR